MNGQAGLVRQLLKLVLPASRPIPVAPAGVRRDVQACRFRVRALTHTLPPVPNRSHRERRRIVVAPHADPRFIAGHVEDTVRNRLPLRVAREIVHAHRRRRRLGLPFAACVREVPHQLFLLGVDRNHRLAGGQKPIRRRIDVLELLVAVRMNRAFLPLAHRLQAVPQAVQQPTHRGRAHPPSLLGQRRGQFRAALARPPQRRCRVPTRQRIYERFEGRHNTRLFLLDSRTSRARRPNAVRRRFISCDLASSLADRLPRQAGRRRHQRVSAIANRRRLGGCPPPATTFVQHRRYRAVFGDDGGFQLHVSPHACEYDRDRTRWQPNSAHPP